MVNMEVLDLAFVPLRRKSSVINCLVAREYAQRRCGKLMVS